MSTRSTKATVQTAAPRQPREGSTIWAAIQVLDGKRKPMTPAEIYTEIRDRKLATGLKGKTPEATVASALAVHAARGLYVERPGPGKYQLKKTAPTRSGPKSTKASRTKRAQKGAKANDAREPAQHGSLEKEPEGEPSLSEKLADPSASTRS